MAKTDRLSDYHAHIARATGAATSLQQAQASWALLGPNAPLLAWDLVFEESREVHPSPVVELLESQGGLAYEPLALKLWKSSIHCADDDVLKQLLGSLRFRECVNQDLAGDFLEGCLNMMRFASDKQVNLAKLLKVCSPPQSALDHALSAVVVENIEASSLDGWIKASKILLDAGANPLAKFTGNAARAKSQFTPANSILMTVAKTARLFAEDEKFLEMMGQFVSPEKILAFKERGRSFAPFWVGGGGNIPALVKLMDKAAVAGPKWWDGDPFDVFSDAMRLGLSDGSLFNALVAKAGKSVIEAPIASHRIAQIIDQGYRSALLSTGTPDLDPGALAQVYEILFKEGCGDKQKLSQKLQFWKHAAPLVAPLFEDPAQWTLVCDRIHQSLVNRKTKVSSAEIEALVGGVALLCQTPNVKAPARRQSRRL